MTDKQRSTLEHLAAGGRLDLRDRSTLGAVHDLRLDGLIDSQCRPTDRGRAALGLAAIDAAVDAIVASLSDVEAFTAFEAIALRYAFRRCRLAGWPPAIEAEVDRASGDCVCETCGRPFRDHPADWRALGYDGRPSDVVLCSGRRVHL
jgi:hypothetical protein